jgi:hypothetical protein
MRAALKAQIIKTDRNGPRGIAHMMRAGLYRPRVTFVLSVQNRNLSSVRLHLTLDGPA